MSSDGLIDAITRSKPKPVAKEINAIIRENKVLHGPNLPKAIRENPLGKTLSFKVNSLFQ